MGDTPVVNPVRLVDGKLPEVAPTRWDDPRWALPTFLVTVAMLAALVLGWLYAPATGGSFIYQNF